MSKPAALRFDVKGFETPPPPLLLGL
jgi:hypothetical protein